MCLLKIFGRGWFLGKHLSMMLRNFLPKLVLTLPRRVVTYEAESFLAVSCINSVVHR